VEVIVLSGIAKRIAAAEGGRFIQKTRDQCEEVHRKRDPLQLRHPIVQASIFDTKLKIVKKKGSEKEGGQRRVGHLQNVSKDLPPRKTSSHRRTTAPLEEKGGILLRDALGGKGHFFENSFKRGH